MIGAAIRRPPQRSGCGGDPRGGDGNDTLDGGRGATIASSAVPEQDSFLFDYLSRPSLCRTCVTDFVSATDKLTWRTTSSRSLGVRRATLSRRATPASMRRRGDVRARRERPRGLRHHDRQPLLRRRRQRRGCRAARRHVPGPSGGSGDRHRGDLVGSATSSAVARDGWELNSGWCATSSNALRPFFALRRRCSAWRSTCCCWRRRCTCCRCSTACSRAAARRRCVDADASPRVLALVVMALLDVLRARLLAAAGARARPAARPAGARGCSRRPRGSPARRTPTACATSNALRGFLGGAGVHRAVRCAVAADLPAGHLPVPSAARRASRSAGALVHGAARGPERALDARAARARAGARRARAARFIDAERAQRRGGAARSACCRRVDAALGAR